MPHQVLEQAGQRREAVAHRRGGGPLLLAHDPLPGDDGAMIHLAQHVGGGDAERLHEMRHIELVGAAGAGALLAGQPDLFLGDGGEGVQAGELAGSRGESGQGRGVDYCLTHTRWRARDKLDYHVLIESLTSHSA